MSIRCLCCLGYINKNNKSYILTSYSVDILGGVNMLYAVDIIKDIMTKLSSSEPVLFQRDGYLYIASKEGFAQITKGLRTEPDERKKIEEQPNSSESKDVIVGWVDKDSRYRKPKFRKGEEKYLKPILFGTDDDSFSLKEITKIAEELAKLPDDGQIRMVKHSSSYHSHKYGYASDG